MKTALPIASILGTVFTFAGYAAVNVPLTVQEAIYPGSIAGIARTADPVTIGVPLPDDPTNGISDVNQLSLTGASVGQFRVLARWPSGRIKWVLVDTQANVSAGGANSSIALTSGGTGAFGGGNLATDNGATITIATGTATFTVKKSNFNVFDIVDVGAAHVVLSGASSGLVISGPVSPATSCGACTTLYTSANDAGSTVIIEENGPAKVVLKATGAYKDSSGNAYLKYTLRMYFYRNLASVGLVHVRRNADYGTSNTFATAYKGFQADELRIAANLSGTLNYSVGNETSAPTSGTMSGSDSVSIYQGQAQQMQGNYCAVGSSCANLFTPDNGFAIKKNGSTLRSGSVTQYPQGWADISNGSGTGIEIGVPEFASRWPVSLEFNGGGSDVRIGIAASENSQPYYQNWPQWKITPLWVGFHAAAPASLPNEFLKAQHYLVGRAPRTQYNAAGVFPFTLADPAVEDAYYASLGATANPAVPSGAYCCAQDWGTTDSNNVLRVYRNWGWHGGGADTELDFHWSNMQNFIRRGMPGRMLEARNFYRMSSEVEHPHADGFNWRDQAHAEMDGLGQPNATSANADKALCGVGSNGFGGGASCGNLWHDMEHWHSYGIGDYYFMTGDETVKEALLGMKDFFLNNWSYQGGFSDGLNGHASVNGTLVTRTYGSAFTQDFVGRPLVINAVEYTVASVSDGDHLTLTTSAGNNSDLIWVIYGGLYNTRSVASYLLWATRFSQWLGSMGDPDAAAALNQATTIFDAQVKPPLCNAGYPAGCTYGGVTPGPWLTEGTSPVRGMNYASVSASGTEAGCGYTTPRRVAATFMQTILAHAIWEFSQAKGTGWSDYWKATDQAYGLSQWALNEAFADNGGTDWSTQGFRFGMFLDSPSACSANYVPIANGTIWSPFFVTQQVTGKIDWERKFQVALRKVMGAIGNAAVDFWHYEIAYVINGLQTAGSKSLQPAAITSVTDNGGGSYTLHWTTPPGTDYLRIKYGPLKIVEWIGFDAGANTFIGDPTTTMNWFAATNATGIPAPVAGDQAITIQTGLGSGLTAANFSVKAFTSGTVTASGNLVMISGNSQTGAVGQPLANPFVVKVTDPSGNPVSGASVTFAVTAGGGSLSSAVVTTNSQGTASTILTLGAAAGNNSVAATSGSITGALIFTATGTATASSSTVTIVSGNGQSGTVGQALPSPLVVQVTNGSAQPVSGVAVTFAVTGGGGSLSATTVNTDGNGQASSVLTLGPAAGSNTVTVSSASSTPITFTANAISTPSPALGGASVNWTTQPRTNPWPAFIGWAASVWDPVSQQTIWYLAPGTYTGIYSTHMFFYDAAANAFTDIGGTSSSTDACPVDTPNMPGDRHPSGQLAVDTKRNMLWIFGGVNVNCMDNPHQDMYYLTLNANPTLNTWHQVTPAHIPLANGPGAMVYDPDDDVLFTFGSDTGAQTHDNWVYCRTAENPTPGTLTPKQSAAGCVNPDDWTLVAVTGGVQPAGVGYSGLVYDVVTHKVIQFEGQDGAGTAQNQTWAYDVPTRTWTRKALATVAPPLYTGPVVAMPAMAYNSTTGKVLYHQTSNTGAPADWQYDPVADTWTKLSSSGGGSPIDAIGAYDPKNNVFLTWNKNVNTGFGDIWKGTLASGGTPISACDLNADGVVNTLDSQLAIQQALGTAQCTADLNLDGLCNIIDVQRVINATLGAACVTGR